MGDLICKLFWKTFAKQLNGQLSACLSSRHPKSQTPRAQDKWSPREIVGHLIDSAANNHQRFVRAQFTDDLVFSGYQQAEWVGVQAIPPGELGAISAAVEALQPASSSRDSKTLLQNN